MSLFSLLPALSTAPKSCCKSEQTSQERPVRRPRHTLRDEGDNWVLNCFLPGIERKNVELTADKTELRIKALRDWKQPENWTALYRESSVHDFELVLSHDNAIDPENIKAELKDGILSVRIAKAAEIKPQKIAVN
jgi:HSP20 family protein